MPDDNPNDLLEIRNPTEDDITVKYANVPHILLSGEKRVLQRFIAEHICKHLTDRELLKLDHKFLNSEELRKEWRDKVIIGVAQYFEKGKDMTEGEKIKRQTELAEGAFEKRLAALEETNKELAKSKEAKEKELAELKADKKEEPAKKVKDGK